MSDYDPNTAYWDELLPRLVPGHQRAQMLPSCRAKFAGFSTLSRAALVELFIKLAKDTYAAAEPRFRFVDGDLSLRFDKPHHGIERVVLLTHVMDAGKPSKHNSVFLLY